jgi:O-antigen/teichoic acid export membrane protein
VLIAQIKNHLTDKLFANTYLIMAVRLLGTLSGFIFWAIAARSMSAEQVGLASGAVAAAGLLARLAQLGLGQGLVRYLPAARRPGRLVNMSIDLTALVGLGLALVFLAGLAVWSPALVPLRDSLLAMAAFTALTAGLALTNLLNWAFIARRAPRFSLAKNAFQGVLSIVLLAALGMRSESYLAILVAYTLAVVAGFGLALIVFLPRSEPKFRLGMALPGRLRSPFTGYVLSNYVTEQLRTAPHSLIPLLVVNVLGPADGAYFFIVWSIAIGLNTLATSVDSSYFAEGANRPEMAGSFALRSSQAGVLYAGVFTLGAALLGRLVLLFYGPEYAAQGYMLLILLTASNIPGVVFAVYLSFLRICDRVILLMAVAGLDLVLGVVLTVQFMQSLGLIGIGIGWLLSKLLMLLCVAVLWQRQKSHARQPASIAALPERLR